MKPKGMWRPPAKNNWMESFSDGPMMVVDLFSAKSVGKLEFLNYFCKLNIIWKIQEKELERTFNSNRCENGRKDWNETFLGP
jgi:hypothetical protein